MSKFPEEERNLHMIDDAFYDEHLVNRMTGNWLAGETVWVIACSDRTILNTHGNYRPGLLARSVHILADIYREKKNFTMQFGLVDVKANEILKETLYGSPIAIIMLKDGMTYRDRAYLDGYH